MLFRVELKYKQEGPRAYPPDRTRVTSRERTNTCQNITFPIIRMRAE